MENWAEIADNPNYLVSDKGQVKRKDTDRLKALQVTKGYLQVNLYQNGNSRHKRVNRLVAEAFVPNPDNKPEVNHIDGNKLNNDASNLEWVTKKENVNHAWDRGLVRPSYGMRGKQNPNAGRKSKPFKIVETGEVFDTLQECETKIRGNNRHISECLNGKQKTHRGYHFEYV